MRKFLISIAALVAITAGAVFADTGPSADVAALRALQHQLNPSGIIDRVQVFGNYAMLTWHTNPEGIGSPAFARVSGHKWKRILVGGETEMSSGALIKAGVPASTARQMCGAWGTPQYPKNSPCMN
jgi:hypothetical protein